MSSQPTIEETDQFLPVFTADGLIPCIAADAETGAVLMMAWMNEEALRLTIETGIAHYWSRSRQTLWKKGETSGALQRVISAKIDCDQDTVLLNVNVDKPEDTCHTGRTNCFYRSIVSDKSNPTGLKLQFDKSG
jgi:phosphoribosyl-AMP cyclohydrolase